MHNEFSGSAVGNVLQIGTVYGNIVANSVLHPHQLPLRLPDFVNRSSELDILRSEPAPDPRGPRVIVLYGESGMGKTSLATEYLHELAERFPGGQLHAVLTGGVSPEEVLDEFLVALGVARGEIPVSLHGKAGLYRTITTERRVLVQLDDAISVAQVRPLLPSPGSVVVVTSHVDLRRLGGESIALDAFGSQAAIELLGVPSAVLVEACRRVPVALDTLRRLIEYGDWSVEEAVRRLSDDQAVLKMLASEGEGVFEVSYESLSDRAARTYRLLASHPGPDFAAELAAAVEPGGDEYLPELEQAGFLRKLSGGRYCYASLARAHALQRAETSALAEIVGWYLDLAIAADKVISRFRWRLCARYEEVHAFEGTDEEALNLLETERANFVHVVRAADESTMDNSVVALCEALWGLHFHRKHYADWRAVNEIGVRSAVRLGDRRAEARIRCQLGFYYYELDSFAEARQEFAAALEADESVLHEQGMATDLESLALAHYGLGEYEEALSCLVRAEPLAAAVGQAQQMTLRGHHYYRVLSALGRHEEAIAGLTETRERLRKDRYNEGRVLTSLGEAHLRAGDHEAARAVLTEALQRMRDLRRLFQEAVVREALSKALLAAGDHEGAREQATTALAIYRVLDHPRAAAAEQRLVELD